jgi:succinate-semialdehyde dehydrogenase/glutarate-semialdehyde dehydrogenase
MSTVVTLNPATGKPLAEYPAFSDADVDAALDRAAEAQTGWAALPLPERAAVLRRAAEVLRAEAEDLALLVTREMGKPLAEARAEVEKCATACDYYAEHAAEFLADEPVATSADRSWIGYEPVGVVLAVMPWNFPLWQVLRFAAPALMAGNAALLKHSPNTTGCALAVQRVLADAGAPEGLFTALVVAEPEVPAVTRRLIEDPRIGAVTITGSERAGRAVGSTAGGPSKSRSSNWAARIRSSSSPTPTCPASRPWPPGAGTSTPGRAVSHPSGSSSTRRSPTSSPACSSPRSRR